MRISELANAGASPVLRQMFLFTSQRQRLLAHNVANLDTPDFRPMDVSPRNFQQELRRAVEERRERTGGESGSLNVRDTDEVDFGDRRIRFKPETSRGGVLYHDRNNRDLERLMQDMAENQLMYRATLDLMRRQSDLTRTAISQRV
jgi:flagellar basal-body rod protein FlgB